MTAVFSPSDQQVYLFGGQDSERDEQFEDMWCFSDSKITQVEFKHEDPVPAKRNSHSMVAT
jgi:hypothetical protein